MPSDDRLRLALAAIEANIAAYRSAISVAAERVRAMLAVGGGADRARIELGALGAMRIDPLRFAELSRGAALDASTREVIGQASEILRAIGELPDSAFVVTVPSGERASMCISNALANFGRAFVAARIAELARGGHFDAAKRAELELAYGPDRWTSGERSSAPPIVAVVNGADLHAADLSELLDGAQHVLLVIEGPCAPAPLVRSITPGTFVLQTGDDRGLDRFRDFRGPAIAALVDAGAAWFAHDPARGHAAWQRLEIWQQPASMTRKRVGGLTARQQNEELAQLAALAAQPTLSPSRLGDFVPAGADSVDRLADWLLTESGLGGRS